MDRQRPAVRRLAPGDSCINSVSPSLTSPRVGTLTCTPYRRSAAVGTSTRSARSNGTPSTFTVSAVASPAPQFPKPSGDSVKPSGNRLSPPAGTDCHS